MFADARTIPTDTRLEADICIIGAGAAGITLAREFSGSPLQVVLLESGDLDPDPATQALYQGTVTGLPYFPLTIARLRYFGGSTNHWGGVCRPFEETDFEVRDWIPLSGWPIRKADLDPFYATAGEICGLRSTDWGAYDSQETNRSSSPLSSDRVRTRTLQMVPSASRSFGKVHRQVIRQSTSVTAYLNANVLGIEANENATTATHVRVATHAGNRFSVAARLFVLATGGIENPRVLLASNRQRTTGLGNQNDLVGRFFLEHPRFVAGLVIPTNPYMNTKSFEWRHSDRLNLRDYFALSPEVQKAESLVDVQLRVQPVFQRSFSRALNSKNVASLKSVGNAARRREMADDFGVHLRNVVGDLTNWQKLAIPGSPIPVPHPAVVRELIRSSRSEARALIPDLLGDIAAFSYKEAVGAPLEHLLLTARIEQVPNRDSRIRLADDRDELGVPRAQLEWRLSPIDKRSVHRTMELFGREIGRTGTGRLKMLIDENEATWPEDLAGGFHHMGTTRMSDDPKQGVVDRNCRVHEMSNLFIAGSSVFPTGCSGTPTLTLVALALRLAEHLKGVAL